MKKIKWEILYSMSHLSQTCLLIIGFVILVILIGLSIQKNMYIRKGGILRDIASEVALPADSSNITLIGPTYYTYYEIEIPGSQTRRIHNIGETHTLSYEMERKYLDWYHTNDIWKKTGQFYNISSLIERLPDLMSNDFPHDIPLPIFLIYLSTRDCWDIYAECELYYLRSLPNTSPLSSLCAHLESCGASKGIDEDIKELQERLSSSLGTLKKPLLTTEQCDISLPGLRFHQVDTRLFNDVFIKKPVILTEGMYDKLMFSNMIIKYLIALYTKTEYPDDLYDFSELLVQRNIIRQTYRDQRDEEYSNNTDPKLADDIEDKWTVRFRNLRRDPKWNLLQIKYVDVPENRLYHNLHFKLLRKQLEKSLLWDHQEKVINIVKEIYKGEYFGDFIARQGPTEFIYHFGIFQMNIYTLCRVLRKKWKGESTRPLCKLIDEPINSIIYTGSDHSRFFSMFIELFFKGQFKTISKMDQGLDNRQPGFGMIQVEKSNFRLYP